MLTNILGERGDHGGRAEVPGEIIDYRPCMMYSSMAVLIWTPITKNEGARTPGPPQDRRHCRSVATDSIVRCSIRHIPRI